MAIASPILNNRTTTVKTQSTSASASGIKNIQETLIKQGKVRKEILDRKKQIRDQRKEREKRRLYEDQLEASGLVIKPSGPVQMIQRSTKGFLERLLGFLAYLTAGWLLNNLPTWIAMGKEFIGRVQRMGQLITGFLNNITNIFTGFGKLLSAAFQNLIQFDLFDTSNRVKNAFSQLTTSIDGMGAELEEAIRLITTPLTEGMVTGEDAPPLGTEQTNEGAYESGEPLQGDSGGIAPSGLFELIAGGEGGYESMNRGNAGDSPGGAKKYLGKNLQDMTLSEIMSLQSRGAVFAVGKYQIVTGTMPGFVGWLQSKGYDPKTTKYTSKIQDLYPQYTIESKRPQVGKFLSGSMNDIQKANLELAAEFASVGVPFDMKAGSYGGGWPKRDIKKGESLYSGKGRNRASISPEKVQQALKQAKESGGNSSTSSSQSQSPQSQQLLPSKSSASQPNVRGKSGYVGSTNVIDTGYRDAKGRSIKLNPSAAKAFRDMISAGMPFNSANVANVYRDEQEYLRLIREGYKPASNSSHNYGKGADIHGAMNAWMKQNGKKYGWHYVHYDGTHGGHFEFRGGSSTADIQRQQPAQSQPSLTQSQPEPQLGSRNSSGKLYTGKPYGYQSLETIKKNNLLAPEILRNSSPIASASTPQSSVLDPTKTGASNPAVFAAAQKAREEARTLGLPPEEVEKRVVAASIAAKQGQSPAQISSSSTQQIQQLSQDRAGSTIVVQQPSSPGSQGTSYSPSGGSRMMPISIDEITLLNNFMKNKLLLDLAYL